MLRYHNLQWLFLKRAEWLPVDGISNKYSLVAGRTGTRCNPGRPRFRWEEGVCLARELVKQDTSNSGGRNALSIGIRIRNAWFEFKENVHLSFPSFQS